MSPVSQADGHDKPRPISELVPRLAAVVEDVWVGGEDPVRDPVLAHLLPDVLGRVQLRRLGRERYKRDGVGDHKSLRLMPARLVHQDRACAPGATAWAISFKCNVIPSVVQRGSTKPAPLP